MIDADGDDSNSVEILEEDSDSGMSAQTVREIRPDVSFACLSSIRAIVQKLAHTYLQSENEIECLEDDYMPLFSTKEEELDYVEREIESAQNRLPCDSSMPTTVEVKEEVCGLVSYECAR